MEDNGELAINKAVDLAIRNAPEQEIAAYAPLAGLPAFLDLSKSLAFGDARDELENLGFHFSSTASPGEAVLFTSLRIISLTRDNRFCSETATGAHTKGSFRITH